MGWTATLRYDIEFREPDHPAWSTYALAFPQEFRPIVKEPVEYTGFKLFYHNDTKKGDPLMTPQDLLRLNPKPVYVQYQ